MSQTTRPDLDYQRCLVRQQIVACEAGLQRLIHEHSAVSLNDPHRANLFAESYYLNELLGYLREQHRLASHYIVHLADDGPDLDWDRKVFWDYTTDESFKQKCLQTIQNPYFHHLWQKEMHFLKSHLHRKLSLYDQIRDGDLKITSKTSACTDHF